MPPAAPMPGRMRRPGRELPVYELAFDLKPDEQEEQRHKGVVDPVKDAQPGDIGSEYAEIGMTERRVGERERSRSRCHENDASGRFAAEKGAENGWTALSNCGGSGHAGHLAAIQSWFKSANQSGYL
jgi:hypothetical protein